MQFRWKQCWRLLLPEAASRGGRRAEIASGQAECKAAARTVEISFFMVVIFLFVTVIFRFVFVLSYVVVSFKQRNTSAHRAAYSGDCIYW